MVLRPRARGCRPLGAEAFEQSGSGFVGGFCATN